MAATDGAFIPRVVAMAGTDGTLVLPSASDALTETHCNNSSHTNVSGRQLNTSNITCSLGNDFHHDLYFIL
jgi:hypothetical protein